MTPGSSRDPAGGAWAAAAPGGGAPPAGEPPVRIESLAAGGDGVGRLGDGMAVFVPRTAPGDVVRPVRVRRHRRHAQAAAGTIVTPGPGRVEPRCLHVAQDDCGGCQWQHLGPAAQAAAKARIVGDALRRLGKLDVADPEVVPSPRAFGYRASVTLTVRRTPAGPVAGFHRAADAEVFRLRRCEIAREELNALWAAIAPALETVPDGDDLRLKLRRAPGGSLHVITSGGRGPWSAAHALADAAAGAGLAATVWWVPARGAPRRVAGPAGERTVLAFEQVNPEVAVLLRGAVVAAVPADAGRVLDLYGGTGDVALALAGGAGRPGREVVLVEVDEEAARGAASRAREASLRIEAVAARVEDVVERLLPADAVVVNPPRAGLAPAVCAALAARPPARFIYVSCDPATLARDLRRLDADPARLAFTCYDMFPQTSHVETVAVLSVGEK